MNQQVLFGELLPPSDTPDTVALAASPVKNADTRGISAGVEVATWQRGEFLTPITIWEFPNISTIIRHRAEGQGVAFYDTMLGTNSDMAAFFRDLTDGVLHFPMYVRAASDKPEHQLHKRFVEFAIREIPHFQNARRHAITAYPRGFSITEKIYKVVDRGEWTGAVIYAELLDKPARWFTYDPDRRLRFRTLENFLPGVLLPQEKFWQVAYGTNSNPWGDPLLDLCYWPWFLDHHATKNQAIFFEKWASPTAKIEYEYSSNAEINARNRAEALAVVNAIQADTAIALPKGMILSLIESGRSGTISFEQYRGELRNMLSRLITGQVLLGSGEKGGSYALAKVHQEQEGNRVEALSEWDAHIETRLFRELIDRNFGPQDAYPTLEILSRNLAEQQAWLEIEALKLVNGHKVSVAWSDRFLQSVLPDSPADELMLLPGSQPGQPTAIPPSLTAAPHLDDDWAARSRRIRAYMAGRGAAAGERVELARPPRHRELHAAAKVQADETRRRLDSIGAHAASKARPAIKRVVRSIASRVRNKKRAKSVTKSYLLKGLKGYAGGNLGGLFQTMMDAPAAPTSMAEGDTGQPPDISDAAKIALALEMYAIVDSIASQAAEAPDEMSADEFANSLLDENAASGSVVETRANLFEGTHSTNIASIATGKLRQQLADPAFRQANPYVMLVNTDPNARLPHKMLDGYIQSSEAAQFSPILAPLDFGCDCQNVLISEETAQEMGLTGAAPTGTARDYAASNGAPAHLPIGRAPGFLPAYAETDTQTQLAALREKAAELQRTDPEAWASMAAWLLWLFDFQILTQDPPVESSE